MGRDIFKEFFESSIGNSSTETSLKGGNVKMVFLHKGGICKLTIILNYTFGNSKPYYLKNRSSRYCRRDSSISVQVYSRIPLLRFSLSLVFSRDLRFTTFPLIFLYFLNYLHLCLSYIYI